MSVKRSPVDEFSSNLSNCQPQFAGTRVSIALKWTGVGREAWNIQFDPQCQVEARSQNRQVRLRVSFFRNQWYTDIQAQTKTGQYTKQKIPGTLTLGTIELWWGKPQLIKACQTWVSPNPWKTARRGVVCTVVLTLKLERRRTPEVCWPVSVA